MVDICLSEQGSFVEGFGHLPEQARNCQAGYINIIFIIQQTCYANYTITL